MVENLKASQGPIYHLEVFLHDSADPATMTGKVPSFSSGSPVKSTLHGYLALFLALQIHRPASAQFRVSGPDHPVTASLGGEAILPCHLSPRMSAKNMEVRWFRAKYSAIVHLYRDGEDQYGLQMPEYRGRTELLKDDITSGRVSLRIHNVQPSDHGQYTCHFQSSVSYAEALLELQVAGLGSDPDISMEGHQDGGVQVVCRSSGWYPQPEAQWRDLQGQVLSSTSEKNQQAANGLFQTEIAIVLTDESNQIVSCHVWNPQLDQERESAVSIAELFFMKVNPWLVALAVILSLLAGLIALGSYCFWRQHKAKETLKADMESKKETLLSGQDREKETLLSEWEREKENLHSEMERQKAEYEAAKKLGLARARGYSVDVTLDPDTANPNLVLSEDRKSVRLGDTRQDLPNNPERFNSCICVLGAEGFTAGRCYWEVEVGDKTGWTLGVCRESVRRKQGVIFTPEDGYWVMRLRDGEYKTLTSYPTSLPVSTRPNRLGIFLDYKAGEVSFYNVTDGSHLFTFTSIFSGMLHPFFSTGVNTGGTNAAPLTICPVSDEARGNPNPSQ